MTNGQLPSGDPALPGLALPDSAPVSCLHTSGYLCSLCSARLSETLSSGRLSTSAPGSRRLELRPPQGSPLSFPAPVFCISNLCLGRFHPFVTTGVFLSSHQNPFFQRTERSLRSLEQKIFTSRGKRSYYRRQAGERWALSPGGHRRRLGHCRLSYLLESLTSSAHPSSAMVGI